jgi:hypothetical protein
MREHHINLLESRQHSQTLAFVARHRLISANGRHHPSIRASTFVLLRDRHRVNREYIRDRPVAGIRRTCFRFFSSAHMQYRKHLHMRMTTHDQFSDDIRAHPRDMTNIERIHKNMQIPSMAEKGSGSEVAVADLDKKHPNKPEPPSSFKEVLSDQRIGSVVTTKVMNGSSQLYWSLRLHPLMAHTPEEYRGKSECKCGR